MRNINEYNDFFQTKQIGHWLVFIHHIKISLILVLSFYDCLIFPLKMVLQMFKDPKICEEKHKWLFLCLKKGPRLRLSFWEQWVGSCKTYDIITICFSSHDDMHFICFKNVKIWTYILYKIQLWKNVSTVTVVSPLSHPFLPQTVITYMTSAGSEPITWGCEML